MKNEVQATRAIHAEFTAESDALWARFQSDELTHAEYRALVDALHNEYRAALRDAWASAGGQP